MQRGNDNQLSALKKHAVFYLSITGLYIAFYVLTAANDFISFKVVTGVMIVLAWLVLMICYLFFIFNKQQDDRKLQKFLASISDEQLKYSVKIDSVKVVITSTNDTSEFPWTAFDRFGIHKETIYVFNATSPLNSLYWNQAELGHDAFQNLLELIKLKSIQQVF